MAEDADKKKFLYVNRKAPYGTIYALESLEVVLIGAAFEQDVSARLPRRRRVPARRRSERGRRSA